MTPDTTPAELEQALADAAAAAPALAASEPAVRAGWIRAVADALDAAADELVPIAMRESSLPEARLRGEVARSSGQLRLFAEVLDEGSLLEVVIDTADAEREASAASGPASRAGPARACAGVRGQQLPVRVQRVRRRHGVRAGRRLPGDRQGTPGPPRAVGADGRGDDRGAAGRRAHRPARSG